MKIKTSITISEEILFSIDSLLAQKGDRSEFIERILSDFLDKIKTTARGVKDIETINKNADRLNKEAEDVLSYQVKL